MIRMKAMQRRIILWTTLIGVLLLGLFFAFRPQAVTIDLIELVPGDLTVTIDEEGETRVRDIFVLSAPVAGRALRIEAEAGDSVIANETVIAEIEPVDPTFLDLRSATQAEAAVRAAESAKILAQAEVDQAQAELDFARAELDRARELILDNTISQRSLDDAERAYKTGKAIYATTLAALQVSSFELERVRAQLLSPSEARQRHGECDCVPITSPVDGQILRILHESAGVVSAGEKLLEIGDPRDLEIVVDLLSSDAVKVVPGQQVIIEHWGGDQPLAGRVRRVEPFGFTKVSALGIEEQRVNVIIDLVGAREQWARLGHGYQAELRIVLWQGDDVIKLPLTALFRDGDNDWAVFVEEQGRARRRSVEVGRRNGLEAEIRDGLSVGQRVVAHPGDRVIDGVALRARD
jgi:HlyD family secretion protein